MIMKATKITMMMDRTHVSMVHLSFVVPIPKFAAAVVVFLVVPVKFVIAVATVGSVIAPEGCCDLLTMAAVAVIAAEEEADVAVDVRYSSC